jgi:response regulator RpfG family c-di-GMP phosphodiesterase
VVRIVITGHATLDNAVASMRHGAYDFVGKPFVRDQLITVLNRALRYRRLVVENQRYQYHLEDMIRSKNGEVLAALDEIKRSHYFTLEALVAILDSRESETSQHSGRVRDLTMILAAHMQLDDAALNDIGRGAQLHDIGKIGIPDAILLKSGALTDDEWVVMKQHPVIGYNFLKQSSFLKNAAEIVLAHHEHYDGTGYPRGLQGEQICLGARIFSVIDVYDAMRSPRRYKKSMSVEEASEEIRSHSGSYFDSAIVKVFFECHAKIENAGMWSHFVAMSS